MPIKIYWGPPGSYKTASAVWDDVAECARQGRVLITNVRGLTEAKCSTHLDKIAPGFRVMHFDTSIKSQMDVLRRWPWWAPFGAYFVLDEVQAIYPAFWTGKEMRAMDRPAGDGRRWPSGEWMPGEVEICFDMHRHGNWDFTFTTPNIKKVRQEIRSAAEWAYKHRNLAFIGFFKGSYMEFQHSAEDNGNPSDIFSQRRRKVPPHVFKLYDSTATGVAKDSAAGVSIFKNPGLLLLAGTIACLVAFLVYRGPPSVLRSKQDPAPGDPPPALRADLAPGAQSLRLDPVGPVPAVAQAAQKVATATAEASGVVDQAQTLESTSWRLLGVLSRKDGTGVALLANAGARRRVDAKSCKLVDGLTEWACVVDGRVVTRFTGSDVFSETIGTAKPLSY